MVFKWLRKIIFYVVVVLVLIGIYIGYYTETSLPADVEENNFEVIIITGEGTLNKTLLGDVSQRLDYVIKLFENHEKKPRIIFSGYGGGYVNRSEGEVEADLMYLKLVPEIDKLGFNSDEFLVRENKS